jgi:hypothetical protein
MTPGLGLKNWDMGMTNRRKRPRDFSQAAKLVIDIATGQVEDRPPTPEEQGMRHFTRLTNAFSKKVENHACAVALHAMYDYGNSELNLANLAG